MAIFFLLIGLELEREIYVGELSDWKCATSDICCHLFSFTGVAAGMCVLPKDIKWTHIVGAGFLAAIGFTVSIFVTLIAFEDADEIFSGKSQANGQFFVK